MAQSTAGKASSPYTHPAGVGPKGSQHSLQPPALRHCCRRLLHRSLHRPQETPQSCSGQEVHEAPPRFGCPNSPAHPTHQLQVAALPAPLLLCSLQQTQRCKSAQSPQGRRSPPTATPATNSSQTYFQGEANTESREQLGATFWAAYSTSRMVLSSSTQASSSSPLSIRSCRTGTAMRSSRSRHSVGQVEVWGWQGAPTAPHTERD